LKKFGLTLTTAALLVLTTNACGSGGTANDAATSDTGNASNANTQEASTQEASGGTVELTFGFNGGDGPTYDLYKSIFKEYESAHPNVKITPQAIAKDFTSTIMTRIAGGNAPDVFWMSNQDMPSFADRNALLDLTPYDGKDFQSGDFLDNIMAGYKWKGNIYGLPGDAAPIVLFYNKELFDQAKVDYPKAGMSWDDLLQKAQALTVKKGDQIEQYGYAQDVTWNFWAPFVWQNNGDILSSDGTKSAINSPESSEAFTFIRSLMNEHKVAPTASSMQTTPSYQLFQQGKAAMYFGGAWVASTILRDTNFEWDVVAPPAGKTKATAMALGGFAVSKTTKHPEEAVKFLSWLAGEEGQKRKFEGGFAGLPTLKSLINTPLATKGFEHPTYKNIHLQEIVDSTQYARVAPSSANWMQINAEMTKLLQLYWNGEQEIGPTLESVDKKINEILSGK
jgi:multiple sugar transport system substrate-binding protein